MKAASFQYQRASSLEEACTLLQRYRDDARVIAGGQSLVPMMAMRLARPAWLVDINGIAGLDVMRRVNDRLRMGACTRQRAAERDADVRAHVPLLGAALPWIGHQQTRNRGTVCGSLAHADPAAELPLVACVLDAEVAAVSHRGRRSIRAGELFVAPMTTCLGAEELIAEVAWPIWPESHVGAAFAEVSIRQGDFALVCAAAQLAIDPAGCCLRASFGVGGADATPIAFTDLARALVGSRLDDEAIASVAEQAAAALAPGEDVHASAQYRRHLAAVLTARVLHAARARATARAGGT